MKKKIVRVVTVPVSFKLLLTGQLEFLSRSGFDVYAVSANGMELFNYANQNINVFSVPFTRRITPVKDLICLIKLVIYFVRIKPDIVHSHTPKAGLLSMLAAFFSGVPVRLHTVAGMPLMEARGLRKIILFISEYLTYMCATRVYPNSYGLYNYISNHLGFFKKKLAIIGNGSSNGIDTDYFRPTPQLLEAGKSLRLRLGFTSDVVVFGFVGRVVKDKGISELLLAFRSLSEKYGHVRLLIVGEPEQVRDPVSEAELKILHNDQKISFVGFQEDVRPWLLAMDVFVFPSYREGFPNALLQATCMGRMCIATSIPGCEEILDYGNTGVLVPPKNWRALFGAMEGLVLNAEYGKQTAIRAREYTLKRYSRQILWGSLLNEYRSFI